jgi:hypothetical protein
VLEQLELLLKEQESISQWMKRVDERLDKLQNEVERKGPMSYFVFLQSSKYAHHLLDNGDSQELALKAQENTKSLSETKNQKQITNKDDSKPSSPKENEEVNL